MNINPVVERRYGMRLGILTFCVVVIGLSLNNLVQQVGADSSPSPTPTPSGSLPNCTSCPIRDLGLDYHLDRVSLTRVDNGEPIVERINTRNPNASDCCHDGADPSNCVVMNYGRWGDVDVYCAAGNINCSCPRPPPHDFASGGSGTGSGRYGSGLASATLFGQAGFGSQNQQAVDAHIRSDLAQRRFGK